MADGRILKPDQDFTAEVDKQIPAAEEQAKNGDLSGAVDKLLLLEKQTRQASDLASTSRLLVAIVTMCKNQGDWSFLTNMVSLLSKKHGQLKQATTKMVQVVMGFLDETPNFEVKKTVIETLRTVTDGKIFVEVERARVTRILSDMRKQQGNLTLARDTLCELQVETFGSMERREKTEFILEQVALCIETGDWTQAGILGRKISTKYFARKPKKTAEELEKEAKEREELEKKRGPGDPPVERADDDVTDLKMKYYEQQIAMAKHDNDYLGACKHYRQVLDTPAVEEDPAKLHAVLQRIIYYVILAPHNNEQSDLLHRVDQDTRNAQVPADAALLKLFTMPELMRWPVVAERFGPHLCGTDVFARPPAAASAAAASASAEEKKQAERFEVLRKRVIEHNVRVVAKYYTRIRMKRLCHLLDLDAGETERYLSQLVVDKTVYAKIDRPAGVVSFARTRSPDEVLNEWSSDMRSLLGLLERIDHLITKEEMMARIQQSEAVKAR